MTNQLKLSIALVALAAAAPAMGNNTLTVVGKLTPPACDARFDGGATVDFGTIPFGSLSNNGTHYEEKNSQLLVDCGGPTRVSVVAQDNRIGSGITMQEAPGLDWPYQSPNVDKYSWGLGFADGDHIKTGALIALVRPTNTTIDGAPLTEAGTQKVLARPGGSTTWSIASSRYSMNLNPDFEYSFGPEGGPAVPVTHVQLGLGVIPMIGPSSTLPHADEIPVDGSITFTLRYL